MPLAVLLPATLLISSLQCLESVHGASSRYANRRLSCKVFCHMLSGARALWLMRFVRKPCSTCWLFVRLTRAVALTCRTGNTGIAGIDVTWAGAMSAGCAACTDVSHVPPRCSVLRCWAE